ncbi:EpsG family protein [Salirhabdus salicampi]|uniref:EpsG family protein n=1 Tax=Salirhabdus salicampi TaxID=476102 RepID=UPI0020C300F1|nr:EpsG family protein [Salirhabdus salicampi]MCP8617523.1 EpsG family protein [Salirhabdus salicampi]
MEIYFITVIIIFIFSCMATYFGEKKDIKNNIQIKNNRFFIFLTVLWLVLISGLRWQVGTDYWQYSLNYQRYTYQFFNDLLTYSEPGIKFIAWFSEVFYDDYATMFFISSLITIGLFVITISKYSNMYTFSMLLFIFIGVWHGSFNGVKQYLACAILLAGHRHIISKSFVKYLLIVLLAGTFHYSALGMIILYFVPSKILKIRHIILLMFVSFAVIYSYDYIFELIENIKADSFAITQYVTREVNLLRILVNFAPLIVYFTITNKSKLSKEDLFYVNLLFINAAFALATSQSAYLARFLIYTNAFAILGIPRLINIKDKYLKFLLTMIIVILYAVFWYIDVSKTSALVNFQWIFNRN